jgi:hypothetical protein
MASEAHKSAKKFGYEGSSNIMLATLRSGRIGPNHLVKNRGALFTLFHWACMYGTLGLAEDMLCMEGIDVSLLHDG